MSVIVESKFTSARWRSHHQPVRVLLMGNNPMTLGDVQDQILQFRDATYLCEVAFDISDALRTARHFKPEVVLIDGSFGPEEQLSHMARFRKDKDTRHALFVMVGEPDADVAGSTTLYLTAEQIGNGYLAQYFQQTLSA